jgi:choline dehydrogenase
VSETFDYIIVGGGTAGSVLASRLTEMDGVSVLLLEAGQAEITDAVTSPQRWNQVLLTDLDWAYMSEPQPGLHGTRVYSAAGRGLGGSSNLYHMMHTRGRPADYDAWAYAGCPGWSYSDVLPFLQRLENQTDGTNPTAGHDGPLTVTNAKDTGNPVSATFLAACAELGFPEVDDFNSAAFGAGWHHVNVRDGQRCGAYRAYLEPALRRDNLSTRTGALATSLLFTGQRCTGVRYLHDGSETISHASQEVIVCAGAIQSPKLLLLSGIGDPGRLADAGVTPWLDLPGVGENFCDHPLVIGPVGYLDEAPPDPRGQVTEVALFTGSAPGLPVPDLEICLVHRAPFGEKFFENVIKRVQTGEPLTDVQQLVDPRVILALPGLVRPFSRGSVRLAGRDPTASPRISANYYGDSADLDRTVTMVEIAREIYHTQAFKKEWELTELAPGPDVRTRSKLADWVVANTGSYYHFAGSCKMGTDDMAVVDSRLRVRGTEGLRVVDASVMPSLTSSNPHTSVVMIAERAAEFIRQELADKSTEAAP